jgi:hypothetical protein
LGLGPQPGFKEKKGKSINFKCWANGGLEAIDLLWRLLDRQDVYHRFCACYVKKLVAEDWQDEVANDIAFPMVNIKS